MASKGDDTMAGLSIRKHKNFGKLALYSIECLQRVVAPPASGWAEQASLAQQLGAAEAIGEVLSKPANVQGALFSAAVTTLASMARASSRGAQSLADSAALDATLAAFLHFWDSTLSGGTAAGAGGAALDADEAASAVTTLEQVAGVLFAVASRSPEALLRKPAALPVTYRVTDAAHAGTAPVRSTVASSLGVHVLASFARTKGGLEVLTAGPAFTAVMSAVEAAVMPSNTTTDTMRVLSPSLRLLEKAAWDDAALDALRKADTVSRLAGSVQWLEQHYFTTLGSLAVRILSRIIGNDLSSLVATACGESGASPADCEFAAALLASLMLDGTMVETVITDNHVPRLIKSAGAAVSVAASGSLLDAVARVAASSRRGAGIVAAAGGAPAVVDTLAVYSSVEGVVAPSVACLAALADKLGSDCPPGAVADGTVSVVVSAVADHAASAPVFTAAASYLNAVLDRGVAAPAVCTSATIAAVVAAVNNCAWSYAAQLEGSRLLLRLLAAVPDGRQAAVDAGAVATALRNLSGNPSGVPPAESAASPSKSVARRFTVSKKGGRDGGGAPAVDAPAASTRRHRLDHAQVVALVDASLSLLAQLLVSPDTVVAAKAAGCIPAVLAGYTRCQQDDALTSGFCEVVELVVRDPDVRETLDNLAVHVHALRLTHGDQGAFDVIDADMGRVDASVSKRGAGVGHSGDLASLAQTVIDSLVLLEAVAMALRLAHLMATSGGVAELLRTLITIVQLRAVAPRKGTAGGRKGSTWTSPVAAAKNKFGGAASGKKGLPEASQDEILRRTSRALVNLLRVAGHVEFTGRGRAADAVAAAGGGGDDLAAFIRDTLCDAHHVKVVTRAIQMKQLLRGHVTGAVRLLGVLACHPTAGFADVVVEAGAVEAAVGGLRSFGEAADAVVALCGSMANIAQFDAGSMAVASRGGSRQLARLLQDGAAGTGAASGWGAAAPSALEAVLTVVDLVADVSDAADMLKKQGIVTVVVGVLDSLGEAAPDVAPDAAAESSPPMAAATASTRNLVTSILSKLLDQSGLEEALRLVNEMVERMAAGISGKGLQSGTLAVGTTALATLNALCDSQEGRSAGHAVWRAVASAALDWVTTATDALAAGQDQYRSSVTLAANTLSGVLAQRGAFGDAAAGEATAWADTAVAVVPGVLRALLADAASPRPLVECLAAAVDEAPAAKVLAGAPGDQWADLVAHMEAAVADAGGDESTALACAHLLSHIAACEGGVTALQACGAVPVAVSMARIAVQEQAVGADHTLPATLLTFLAACCRHAGSEGAEAAASQAVVAAALRGGVPALAMTAVQRFCSGEGDASPGVLAAVSDAYGALAPALSGAGDREGATSPTDAPATSLSLVPRIVVAASSSPAYVDTPACMVSVLRLIAATCGSGGAVLEAAGAATKQAVVAVDGRRLVVSAMSSTAATEAVLVAGKAARKALAAPKPVVVAAPAVAAAPAVVAAPEVAAPPVAEDSPPALSADAAGGDASSKPADDASVSEAVSSTPPPAPAAPAPASPSPAPSPAPEPEPEPEEVVEGYATAVRRHAGKLSSGGGAEAATALRGALKVMSAMLAGEDDIPDPVSRYAVDALVAASAAGVASVEGLRTEAFGVLALVVQAAGRLLGVESSGPGAPADHPGVVAYAGTDEGSVTAGGARVGVDDVAALLQAAVRAALPASILTKAGVGASVGVLEGAHRALCQLLAAYPAAVAALIACGFVGELSVGFAGALDAVAGQHGVDIPPPSGPPAQALSFLRRMLLACTDAGRAWAGEHCGEAAALAAITSAAAFASFDSEKGLLTGSGAVASDVASTFAAVASAATRHAADAVGTLLDVLAAVRGIVGGRDSRAALREAVLVHHAVGAIKSVSVTTAGPPLDDAAPLSLDDYNATFVAGFDKVSLILAPPHVAALCAALAPSVAAGSRAAPEPAVAAGAGRSRSSSVMPSSPARRVSVSSPSPPADVATAALHASIVGDVLTIVSRCDLDGTPAGASTTSASAVMDVLPSCHTLLAVPGGRPANILAVQVLRRLCGFSSPTLAARAGLAPGGGDTVCDKARVDAMAAQGTFKAVVEAMARNVDDLVFSREAIRLLRAVAQGHAPAALKLDSWALGAIQPTVRKYNADEFVREEGAALYTQVSELFLEQSGKGFEKYLHDFVKKMAVAGRAGGILRQVVGEAPSGGDWKFTYKRTTGGGVEEVAPAEMVAVVEASGPLKRMAFGLDPDVITEVPADLVSKLVEALTVHAADPVLAPIICLCLAKLSEHPTNAHHIVRTPVVPPVARLAQRFPKDLLVCEAITSLLRPLSINLTCCTAMKHTNLIPTLLDMVTDFKDHLMPLLPWVETRKAEGRAINDIDEGFDTEPRIAHYAVQAIANVACDQQVETADAIPTFENGQLGMFDNDGATGGVLRIVSANGVAVLDSIMKTYSTRARVLEDSLCALSNMAFATDAIRLLVGRQCATTVVQVTRLFNSDPFLFSMALRAVGNLTRCDENITRVVGFGVIRGIVEGMVANADAQDVVKLAADVVGNLASLDEDAIDHEEGLRELRTIQRVRRAGATDAAGDGAAAPAGDGDVKSAAGDSTKEGDGKEDGASLHSAICQCLYDDGGSKVLIDAMVANHTNVDLVLSCLRSLHYISEADLLVEKMVNQQDLAKHLIFVLRSCDYHVAITAKGINLLAALLREESTQGAAIAAGAPHVVLSALDTHRHAEEVVHVCFAALALCFGPEVAQAAIELRSAETLLDVASRTASNPDLLQLSLTIMETWCADADLGCHMDAHLVGAALTIIATNPHDGYVVTTMYRLLHSRAKIGGDETVQTFLEGGAVRTCVNLARTPEHPEYLWNREVVLPVLNLLILLVQSPDKQSVASLVTSGVVPLLFALRTAYALSSDKPVFALARSCMMSIQQAQASLQAGEGEDEGSGEGTSGSGSSDVQAMLAIADDGMESFPKSCVEDLLTGVQFTVWFLPDMHEAGKIKARTMTLTLSNDMSGLSYEYYSKRFKTNKSWTIRLADVSHVRLGLPQHGGKKGVFGKKAKPTTSLCLEGVEDTVLHLEISSAEEREVVYATLSALVWFARAREPTPDGAGPTDSAMAVEGDASPPPPPPPATAP